MYKTIRDQLDESFKRTSDYAEERKEVNKKRKELSHRDTELFRAIEREKRERDRLFKFKEYEREVTKELPQWIECNLKQEERLTCDYKVSLEVAYNSGFYSLEVLAEKRTPGKVLGQPYSEEVKKHSFSYYLTNCLEYPPAASKIASDIYKELWGKDPADEREK